MDAKKTTAQIDGELESLRAKIRDLEAQKADHVKALDKAKADRKRSAYSAHGDKDPKAQERLSKARAAQRENELALEDLESAISEGRQRFEALQHEHEVVYRAEQWAKVLALAADAQKEAEQIDIHVNSLTQLLGQHQEKIEQLRRSSNSLGYPRAFQTCGVRHAFRIMDWRLIQAGVSSEVEKPSPTYRAAEGYGEIFRQQVEAAKVQPTAQPNGQDPRDPGNGD